MDTETGENDSRPNFSGQGKQVLCGRTMFTAKGLHLNELHLNERLPLLTYLSLMSNAPHVIPGIAGSGRLAIGGVP